MFAFPLNNADTDQLIFYNQWLGADAKNQKKMKTIGYGLECIAKIATEAIKTQETTEFPSTYANEAYSTCGTHDAITDDLKKDLLGYTRDIRRIMCVINKLLGTPNAERDCLSKGYARWHESMRQPPTPEIQQEAPEPEEEDEQPAKRYREDEREVIVIE